MGSTSSRTRSYDHVGGSPRLGQPVGSGQRDARSVLGPKGVHCVPHQGGKGVGDLSIAVWRRSMGNQRLRH